MAPKVFALRGRSGALAAAKKHSRRDSGAHRALQVRLVPLTSAIERPGRSFVTRWPIAPPSPPRSVDICDRAFGSWLDSRLIAPPVPPRTVDIRDEASRSKRRLSGSSRHPSPSRPVDICDEASGPKHLTQGPIAPSKSFLDPLTSAIAHPDRRPTRGPSRLSSHLKRLTSAIERSVRSVDSVAYRALPSPLRPVDICDTAFGSK